MLCEKCGNTLTPGAMKCEHCGNKLTQPAGGTVNSKQNLPDATLRIIPRKKPSFGYWFRNLSTIRILTGKTGRYKIYLYVDDVKYVFESNVGQYDVKVTPGLHTIWMGIAPMHKKLLNALSKVGEGVSFAGKLYGSGETTLIGEGMKMMKIDDNDLECYDFDPGEVFTCRVKVDNTGYFIVADV